jgi:hypothetical protein
MIACQPSIVNSQSGFSEGFFKANCLSAQRFGIAVDAQRRKYNLDRLSDIRLQGVINSRVD